MSDLCLPCNRVLQVFAGGAGIDDASVLASPEGSNLLCFPVACHAPSIQTKGVVVQAGCAAGGAIGDTCRLGCSIGYDETEAVEGRCVGRWLEREEVAVGEYADQAVTCSPARNVDGSMVRCHVRDHIPVASCHSHHTAPSNARFLCRRSPTAGWNRSRRYSIVASKRSLTPTKWRNSNKLHWQELRRRPIQNAARAGHRTRAASVVPNGESPCHASPSDSMQLRSRSGSGAGSFWFSFWFWSWFWSWSWFWF